MGEFCSRLRSYSLSLRLLVPVRMMLLFLVTCTEDLSNFTLQPSSQSWPTDIKDSLVNLGNEYASWPTGVNDECNWRIPYLSAWIVDLSGKYAFGPLIKGFTWCRRFVCLDCRYVWEALESNLAIIWVDPSACVFKLFTEAIGKTVFFFF